MTESSKDAVASARGKRQPSRRDVIRRALTAGGAAYVAPMILGSATPASAQIVSGQVCQGGCVSLFGSCGSGPTCSCYADSTGFGLVCVDYSGPCASGTECDSNADCLPGWVCSQTCQINTTKAGRCTPCCAGS
jgi:hypothetical protein